MDAAIILQKCVKHKKVFGVRVEKMEQDWLRTWAFQINEERAGWEGFDKTKIHGWMYTSEDYPGCPYCGGKEFCGCYNCQRLGCYYGEETYTCPWRGSSGVIVSMTERPDYYAGMD